MEGAREYYEAEDNLNRGQLNVLDFIRSAGPKGVPWSEVWHKCHQEGITSEEFDSLTLLGLIKQKPQMVFTAAEYL